MVSVLCVKIAISVTMPASKDIVDVVTFATSLGKPDSLNGPWVVLTSWIISSWQWTTASALPDQWAYSPINVTPIFRLLLLLLRSPAIAFDTATAIALYHVTMRIKSSQNLARLTSLLWFLNPYNTYAIELLGVPDVAAAFCTVLAVLLLLRGRTALSGVALGAGITLKLYPLFLLPQFLLYATIVGTRRLSRTLVIGFSLLGLLFYFIWALQLGLLWLRVTLVAYTPVTTPVGTIVNFSPSYRISITAFALIVLYFFAWKYVKGKNVMLSHLILPVLLLYYTFSDPYPQYAVWALPFLTMDIAFVKRRNLGLLAIMLSLMFTWALLSNGNATQNSLSTPLVTLPLLRTALAVTTLVYTLEIIRQWFVDSRASGNEKFNE
jgi:hypothetical protein